MHLVDGGVLKYLLEELFTLCTRAVVDPKEPRLRYTDISATEVDPLITFLNKFSLSEQARKLRCLYILYNIDLKIDLK